ncbi:hypothetical protein [Aliidongia dinghuensis]|nr:hypothetical protein [Aliidongia dinghuensis]
MRRIGLPASSAGYGTASSGSGCTSASVVAPVGCGTVYEVSP